MTNKHVGRLAVCAGHLVPPQLSEAPSTQTFSLQLLSQYYHCFTFTSAPARWRPFIWVKHTGELLVCNTFNHHQTISMFGQPNSKNVVICQGFFFGLPFGFAPFFAGKDFLEGEEWYYFCRQLQGCAAVLLPFCLSGGCCVWPRPLLSPPPLFFFFPLVFPICYFILIVWCN